MATNAHTTFPPLEDKVKTLRKLIFHEMIEHWRERDIGSIDYTREVKRRFGYLAASRYGLTWYNDRKQYNNHLSNVFTRLNKSIRATQKYARKAKDKEECELFEELRREKIVIEMYQRQIETNEHICPIDGYPEMADYELD